MMCSNRTFMELKLWRNGLAPEARLGSNRTFMELKRRSLENAGLLPCVLIVPLWN